ncbi:protein unc-13 homolog D-like [Haemaphysalis longicornis]
MERSPFRKVLRRSCRQELCLQCLRTIRRSVGKQVRPYNASRAQMAAFVREVFGELVYVTCTRQLDSGAGTDGEGRSGGAEELRFRFQVRLLDSERLFEADNRKHVLCHLWADEGGGRTTEVSKRKWFSESATELTAEVLDPASSCLVLEVFAKDPVTLWDAIRKLARPGSLSAFLESLRKVFSQYFRPGTAYKLVGRLESSLEDIPCVGVEEWYVLKDTAGHNLESKVQLSVTFHSVASADISVLERIREHYALSFAFLEHNVEQTAEDDVAQWSKWSDCVGRRGLTLLRQHALQNNMQDVEAHCCYLQAATEHRMKVNTQISFVVMYLLLKELQLELGSQGHRFVSDALDHLIQELSDHINCQLENLHEQYYLEFELHVTDLSGALSLCALMDSMSPLPIVDSARTALQKNEKKWYESLAISLDEKATLSIVAMILDKIRTHQQKANRLFQQSWNETYTNVVMHELDDFLVRSLKPWVGWQVEAVLASPLDDSEEKTLDSIEAFSVIKTFLEDTFPLLNVDPEVLNVQRYHEWFGSRVIDRWFDVASRASEIVRGFVAADDLLPLNANVKYSSSFVKTADAINANVVKLWLLIEWPEHACSFSFIDCVHRWVSVYSAAIESKTESERRSGDGNNAAVPARLCVAVNDLMGILMYVQQIRSKIVDSYLRSRQGLTRFGDVEVRLHSVLGIINTSKDRLLDIIVWRLLPGVEPRLDRVLSAQTTLAQEADVDGLLRSITACVTSLRANLEAEAFEAVLVLLWAKLTTLLKQSISRLRTRCGIDARAYSASFLGLSVVIQQLPKCFTFKDCGGLSRAALEGDVQARLRELKEVFRDQHGAGDI